MSKTRGTSGAITSQPTTDSDLSLCQTGSQEGIFFSLRSCRSPDTAGAALQTRPPPPTPFFTTPRHSGFRNRTLHTKKSAIPIRCYPYETLLFISHPASPTHDGGGTVSPGHHDKKKSVSTIQNTQTHTPTTLCPKILPPRLTQPSEISPLSCKTRDCTQQRRLRPPFSSSAASHILLPECFSLLTNACGGI